MGRSPEQAESPIALKDIDNPVERSDSVSYNRPSPDPHGSPLPGSPSPFSSRTNVWAFGWGLNGQLGDGNANNRLLPYQINSFDNTGISDIECSSRSTVFLSGNGEVYTCGRGDDGQLGHGDRQQLRVARFVQGLVGHEVSEIACRGSYVFARTAKGHLYCWGRNDDGQLGLGDQKVKDTPQLVHALRKYKILQVACGRTHTVALAYGGHVFSWGLGDDGQLGHGDWSPSLLPREIEALRSAGVLEIVCGSRHNVAITESGDLFSWGWGQYGQTGHGSNDDQLLPRKIAGLRSSKVLPGGVACGYRHTIALTHTGDVFTWGWGANGQLGHGQRTNLFVPTRMETLPYGEVVARVAAGGRHSIVITSSGHCYTFGRGDDGQLGHGAPKDESTPKLLTAMKDVHVISAAGGWSHTFLVTKAKDTFERDDVEGGSFRETLSKMRWFSKGDIDGFFALLMNIVLCLLLILQLLKSPPLNFEVDMIVKKVLPGTGLSLILGCLFFGFQAKQKMDKNPEAVACALPFGLNTMLLISFVFLVMVPANRESGSTDTAWQAGMFACFLTGFLEILSLPFATWIRSVVPRAAMLSCLAGTALTFVAMNFAFQIFAKPAISLVPMMIILVCFVSGVRLPLNVPAGVFSVVFGVSVAWFINQVIKPTDSTRYFQPEDLDYEFNFYPPLFSGKPLFELLATDFAWKYMSVVAPLALFNIVGDLANLESATAVGDDYNVVHSMAADGILTMVGALFGSCFPTCIYIGHPAFKSMGARAGYSFMNAGFIFIMCFFNLTTIFLIAIPIESVLGILIFVGLVIAAQAFENQNADEGSSQTMAVAVGLVPSIASWVYTLIDSTLTVVNGYVNEQLKEKSMNVTVSLQTMQPHFGSNLYINGVLALRQGFLITAIIYASTFVHVINRDFHRAAGWTFVAAFFSLIGLIHANEVTGDGLESVIGTRFPADADFTIMYVVTSIFLLYLHYSGRGSEVDASIKHSSLWRGGAKLYYRFRGMISGGQYRRPSDYQTLPGGP